MASLSRQTRVARLLLKAVGGLPEKEQQVVLEYLVEAGLGSSGGAAVLSAGPLSPEAKGRIEHRHKEGVVAELARLGGDVEIWRRFQDDPVWRGGPSPNFQMVPVRLSSSQHRLLKDWCAEHGFPMAVVVRGLVERFLEDQERRES